MSLIRKNIVWLLVSQVATWMATLVALIFVPNSLGSTDLGTFGYATAYVGFFTLVGGLGTSIYLSRAVARDYSLIGPYIWNAVLLKIVLWVGLSAVALALAYGLGNRGQTLALIAITCLGMLPQLVGEVFAGALGGMQRMARPAMWIVVQVYVQTVFGILVLALGWGVVVYAVVMTSAMLIPWAAMALMVRPLVRGHRTFDFGIWRLLVVGGIPLLALTFLTLIYGTVDVPILHHLAGSDAVGWYLVAQRWVAIPIFITTAVVAAYFPALSQHGNPLTDEFAPMVNRAIDIVLFVTVPASVGLAFIADDLIRLIYRDGQFDSSIVLVRILAVGVPIMAMDTVLATALVASDRLKRYLPVVAISAVGNPVACVFLINITDNRYGNGAIGAAIVTVMTELWVTLGALHLRTPGVVGRSDAWRLVRIVAASAAMVPVLLLAANLPLAVQVTLGLVSYAVASLAFRVFSLAELREVMRQMTRGRREQLDDEPDGGSGEDATGVGPPSTPRVGGDLYPQP